MALIRYRGNSGLGFPRGFFAPGLWGPRDDIFERFFGDMERRIVYRPAVDVSESDEAYQIAAELPGLSEEDVSVELDDGVITLKGERRQQEQRDERGVRFSERAYGSFQRSFRLPADVDQEGIQAKLKDGVLTVRLPRVAAPQPRQIEVHA